MNQISPAEPARRVITGIGADGKSCITSDDPAPSVTLPRITKSEVWRVDRLPADTGDGDGLDDELVTLPAAAGMVYRLATFPPDEDWAATDAAGAPAGPAGATPGDARIPGMHATQTLDISTVISGELYAILESGETLLRAGDTIVQRGTQHAWSNRSGRPATVVSVMVGGQSSAGQSPGPQ